MNEPRISFRAPDPPVPVPLRADVKRALARGRCSGCCVCHQTCWTWWSPHPPSGYVPLHEGCVDRLLKQWAARDNTLPAADTASRPVIARTGAYARLSSTVMTRSASPTTVVLSGQRAAILPDGFVPGPFWRPGDTADSPWTVIAETATGRTAYPGGTREYAYGMAVRLEKLRETSDRIPVVAASAVSPDGFCEAVWGKPVDLNQPPRWRPVVRLNVWTHCGGCRALRWPGTWTAPASPTCLACLAADEKDDPRPALTEPSYPGDRYVPEEFTKAPKPLGLPKGFGRRR